MDESRAAEAHEKIRAGQRYEQGLKIGRLLYLTIFGTACRLKKYRPEARLITLFRRSRRKCALTVSSNKSNFMKTFAILLVILCAMVYVPLAIYCIRSYRKAKQLERDEKRTRYFRSLIADHLTPDITIPHHPTRSEYARLTPEQLARLLESSQTDGVIELTE